MIRHYVLDMNLNPIVTTTEYDAQGRKISTTEPGNSGYSTHWSYDSLGQVSNVRLPNRGTERITYDYDRYLGSMTINTNAKNQRSMEYHNGFGTH